MPGHRIKDMDYNQARAILVKEGSTSAGKAHDQHNRSGDCPEQYGRKLLEEAKKDFEQTDGQQLTTDHRRALQQAQEKMRLP